MSKRQSGPFHNEDLNPCIEESILSFKCIENNISDSSKCSLFFENYRNCKKFWGNIRNQRYHSGIKPDMPTKEERNRILELKQKGINVISAQD